MYLVQRGKFVEDSDYHSERDFLGLIRLDYMGAAEFEWGALPASRIRMHFMHEDMRFFKFEDIKNSNSVSMWCYCNVHKKDAIHDDLYKYIYDRSGDKVDTYPMKEWNSMPEHVGTRHMYDTNYANWDKPNLPQHMVKDNFWWGIDSILTTTYADGVSQIVLNTEERSVGDFFCFFGGDDRKNLVEKAIEEHYQSVWVEMFDEKERQERLKGSVGGFY